MAVEFKDYYKVLGVAREASAAEIKTAFRKLARQFHPDVAKDKKKSEEKFKEINEANEVLSDPAKRRQYDELGANWQSGGYPPPGARSQPGRGANGQAGPDVHFGGTGFSDFFEQFFGGARGAGMDDILRQARAGGRRGAEYPEQGGDIEGDISVTLHEAMHGSTRTLTLQRTNPMTGEPESNTLKVRIPPGALDGRRIRVPGRGGAGSGGGQPGDLFLRVRLQAHPDFEPDGADLNHELELAPWEAVLGAQVVVPTLTGNIKLTVPPGTNSGRQFRLRGQGLPKGPGGERGDLYALARVQIPTEVSAEEKALWENLAKTSAFAPRSAGS